MRSTSPIEITTKKVKQADILRTIKPESVIIFNKS